MKTILIMRHAKSSWDAKIQDDWQRPLSKRGKKNAQQIGKLLEEEKLVPDLILASAAVRAHQTADIVMEEMKYHGDFFSLNKLYMAEIDVFVQEIQKLPDEIEMILVIGHNPCLDCILQIITGKVESLPTSAVSHLSVPLNSWKDFSLDTRGELVHLWRPKDL